jgi:hypothetical protein
MIKSAPVRGSFVGLFALAALVLAPCAHAECSDKAAQVDVSVSAENKISIPSSQRSVEINLDQEAEGKTEVCWVVTGLKEGYTLEFEQKESTEGSGYFDFDKTFTGKPNELKLERVGVPKKDGTWIYAVRLTGPGEISDVLDPEVIILPGPGGNSDQDDSELTP